MASLAPDHYDRSAAIPEVLMRAFPFSVLLAFTLSVPLTAQIQAAEYAARRAALVARIDSGVVIAFGAVEPVVDWPPFFQLSHFQYLTGFPEPDAVFLLVKRRDAVTQTMFVPARDRWLERFTGPRTSAEELEARIGIAGNEITALRDAVDSLADSNLPFYVIRDFRAAGYEVEDSLTRGSRFLALLRERHPWLVTRLYDDAVDSLRATKSPAELGLVRKAVEISVRAHIEAMKATAPGCGENEIQALMEGVFRRMGGDRPSYGSTVASGPNAMILHYDKDHRVMQDGELVLIDAATSFDHYSADVTRTFPVNGRFTSPEREIYQLVLDAEVAFVRQIKPGVRYAVPNDSARQVVTRGLVRFRLIESADATFDGLPWMQCPPAGCSQRSLYAWRGYGGHGIGLEVHDPAHFYDGAAFQVGDVFTVEPALFFSAELLASLPDTPRNRAMREKTGSAFARYQGIGIKIEDDYALTESGVEWLSKGAPREVTEVEALMRQRGTGLPGGGNCGKR
jgi:Xaa-Pro aminopeptidase